jgi:hypothetical protein
MFYKTLDTNTVGETKQGRWISETILDPRTKRSEKNLIRDSIYFQKLDKRAKKKHAQQSYINR